MIETIVYFNILALAISTWYTLDAGKNNTAAIYLCVTISFMIFLAVITFHVYKYSNLHIHIKNSNLVKLTMQVNGSKERIRKDIKTTDVSHFMKQNQHQPTYSIVEVHNL